MAGGWRLKRMHKQMMLTSVYQRSSEVVETSAKIDPDNRLLWRREPRRLEGEVIRDAMLAVTGQLDETQFGPGTLDEGMRRRSIYFTTKRSKLISMMQIFDQPEPLVSQGNRTATTIAPQALVFMNNPHVRQWSQSFARQAGSNRGEVAERRSRLGLSNRSVATGERRGTQEQCQLPRSADRLL